jgi:hypothetical protein
MDKIVRYSTVSYRIAIVRVLWRTIAQNPGTVRLCVEARHAVPGVERVWEVPTLGTLWARDGR